MSLALHNRDVGITGAIALLQLPCECTEPSAGSRQDMSPVPQQATSNYHDAQQVQPLDYSEPCLSRGIRGIETLSRETRSSYPRSLEINLATL
ncbi:hypothetical protein CGRA01v4_11636 [Colletotrichum graminicola]|nr:hypothetical protein CGRA01v4_11636 [Colletotrichum graminicola]